MIEVTPAHIERFLTNQSDAEEGGWVADYLARHPEVLKIYLIQFWQEAEERAATEAIIPYRTEMLKNIKTQTNIRPRTYISFVGKWAAIAASLVLIIGLWSTLRSRSFGSKELPVSNQIASSENKPWIKRVNETGESLEIRLDDGSTVLLTPQSTISYKDSFGSEERQIWMEGEALYKVAKDPLKPFTVHAGALSTTALGTVFSVTGNESASTVKLYEGKVVVKVEGNKDTYLQPGQQINYDHTVKSVAVTNFTVSPSGKRSEKKSNSVKAKLDFQNTPLPEVLDQLSVYFKQRIEYDKHECNDMYFSGTVLANDSLPVILKVIAQMNSLTMTKQSTGYLIKKPY